MSVRALALLRGDGDPAQVASDSRWRTYGRELLLAGIVLADGVAYRQPRDVPPSRDDQPSCDDSPAVLGFWVWEVSTLEEASEWVRRAPSSTGRTFLEVVPLSPSPLCDYGPEDGEVPEDV